MARIGVFVCWCGANIASTVDVKRVAEESAKIPGVAHSVEYKYMCSDPGQSMIKEAIQEKKLTGIVVAACSPRMHEVTFRRAANEAGVNPYLLEMSNIREQCSWVHSEREEATEKAIDLVRLMVEKAKRNTPLYDIRVPVTQRCLVIGGGVAGIQTALDIAGGGKEVVLVEKEPSIGGHMAQLSETFPTLDCSQCILTPKMVEVRQHPNIKLYTYSELEEISGFVGNFKAKIRKKARSVDLDKCTGCGDCMSACLIRNQPEIRLLPDAKEELTAEEVQAVESVLSRYGAYPSSLIQVLQDVNLQYRYLPENILKYISQRLGVPLPQVYHVATFYTAFSLEPRGEHTIKVCVGTACHARGAGQVLEGVERVLGIKAGQTTADSKFSLETVNCVGCCALGPVVVVDNDYHSMRPSKVEALIAHYK
jgi:NADH:ubiquinone oxidoreductase subunit E/NAD-dependent dihydropyrimidine dehydrogenase PreA subunit